jgi:hypothetical protein
MRVKSLKIIYLGVLFFAFIFMYSCGGGSDIDKEALKEEIRKELDSEQNQEEENQVNIETHSKTAETKTAETKTAETKTTELLIGSFNKSMAKNLNYEGEIVHGESWEDANGKNLMIFTRKEIEKTSLEGPSETSIYLYAYHYADKGDGYKQLIKIQDWEEKCDLVNHAQFRQKTINITDLNKDGKAELTFIYRLGCNGDPTPVTMKLIMLEDGEKYAIRGTTLVVLSPEYKYGGEMNIDASFNKAPKEFLDFAKKIWETDKNYFND